MDFGRDDYNARIIDAGAIIPAEEPVFLIRGKDWIGHLAVRSWAYQHRLNGGSDEAYMSAMRHADLLEAWANRYGKPATLPTGSVDPSSPSVSNSTKEESSDGQPQ